MFSYVSSCSYWYSRPLTQGNLTPAPWVSRCEALKVSTVLVLTEHEYCKYLKYSYSAVFWTIPYLSLPSRAQVTPEAA
jgi:hypothetical protein